MHPVLIELGPLKVHSYGVMLILGVIAAVAWSVREGRRRGIGPDDVVDTGVALLITGLIGARIVYIATHPNEFTSPRQWLYLWEGGLSFQGCLLTGIPTMAFMAWKRRLPLIPFMDVAAPGVALGYAIGRIGCLLNGCCYGGVCDLPWAIRFRDASMAGGLTPPSHPTQIYSAVAGLVLFGFLAWYSPRQKHPGQLALMFLFLYSCYRFVLEFFRKGVSATVVTNGLTQAQIASILIALASLALMIVAASYYRRRGVASGVPSASPAPKEPVLPSGTSSS